MVFYDGFLCVLPMIIVRYRYEKTDGADLFPFLQKQVGSNCSFGLDLTNQ